MINLKATYRIFIGALSFLISGLQAQTIFVTKTSDGSNSITDDLNFGTDRILVIGSGAMFQIENGALIDIPAGSLPWETLNKTGSSLADLTVRSATDLTSGTLPVGRFPSTLPAIDGSALTDLNANAITSGTVPLSRLYTSADGYNITNGSVIDMWGTKTVPAGVVVGTNDIQTLSAKTLVNPIISGVVSFGANRPSWSFSFSENIHPSMNLTLDSPTNTAFLNLDGSTNISRVLAWRYNGRRVFSLYPFEITNNNMSGEMRFESYDDNGNTIDFPLVITRASSGQVEIRRPLKVKNGGAMVRDDIISFGPFDGGLGWRGNNAVLGRGLYAQRDANALVALFSAGSNRSSIFEGGVAGGTTYSPSSTPSSSALRIRLSTYGGTTWVPNTAEIVALTTQPHTETQRGTSWIFRVTPNNSVFSRDAAMLDQDGSFRVTQIAATDKAFRAHTASDAFDRFSANATGTLSWGSGFAPPDLTLGRTLSGLTPQIEANAQVRVLKSGEGGAAFVSAVAGDSVNRFVATTEGALSWGSGTASRDTTLARTAPGVLTAGPRLRLGASNRSPAVGGTLYDYYHNSGSVAGTETDLYADTIPMNTLATPGDKLVAEYGIQLANSSSLKQVKVYFGGVALFATDQLSVSGAASMTLRLTIIRSGAGGIRYNISYLSSNTSVNSASKVDALGGITFSADNILKITGTAFGPGIANNDVLAKLATVEFKPAY